MILDLKKNRSKKEISLYDSNFEHQTYSKEFLRSSNYPLREEIDELNGIIKSKKDMTPVREFIIQRGKENIGILIRLLQDYFNY